MASFRIFKRIVGERSRRHGFMPRVERLEPRQLLDASGLVPLDAVSAAEGEGANIAPDFSLVDMNPASPTYNQPVSPRDYLGSVSVWMFGYST